MPWGQKDKVRFVSARFIVSAIRVRGFQNSNLDSCLAGGGFGDRCGRRLPVAAGEWSRAVRHCGGAAGGRCGGSRERAQLSRVGHHCGGATSSSCGGSRVVRSWRMPSADVPVIVAGAGGAASLESRRRQERIKAGRVRHAELVSMSEMALSFCP